MMLCDIYVCICGLCSVSYDVGLWVLIALCSLPFDLFPNPSLAPALRS